MLNALLAVLASLSALTPYMAMSRVVLAFVFLILLRVTVPRIKVEGISRWGWVIGWALAALSAVIVCSVWFLA
jgi:NADH:ubiquinone oxidoreductase subunit H